MHRGQTSTQHLVLSSRSNCSNLLSTDIARSNQRATVDHPEISCDASRPSSAIEASEVSTPAAVSPGM